MDSSYPGSGNGQYRSARRSGRRDKPPSRKCGHVMRILCSFASSRERIMREAWRVIMVSSTQNVVEAW